MRLSLSKTVRYGCAVPIWLTSQMRRLANLHHLIPLGEMAEFAQPVWRLPRGVQTAAAILSLVGLVGGVRVLDAQIGRTSTVAIATLGDVGGPAFEATQTPPTAIPARLDPEAAPSALLVEELPKGDTHRFVSVDVSGYSSQTDQTDSSPTLTASSQPTRPGTIALSRDLLRTFTPGAPFDFGDRILIPGMGIYVIEDTMHPRWTHKADIWFADTATARRWGNRTVYLTRVIAGEPLLVNSAWSR